MRLSFLVFFLLLQCSFAGAQFAPQVGSTGCDAIYKDSSIIVAWATQCTVKRGWQHMADTTLGKASVGDSSAAVGAAGNMVVSLGDGGEAILTFERPVRNGPGYDFAVFENGFVVDSLAFLELAFVEVSSDGQHYVRFPSVYHGDTMQQLQNGEGMNAANINSLAGKYVADYGTPFDLDIFAPLSSVDINHITHIRIIDVVGSLQAPYASRDSEGGLINDPWPTGFPSSGFDLDAVAVLHQNPEAAIAENRLYSQVKIYPNPLQPNQTLTVNAFETISSPQIFDATGKEATILFDELRPGMFSGKLNLEAGIYFLKINASAKQRIFKLIIQ